jgi:hypothetical protein
MSDRELEKELTDLEQALQTLSPAPVQLDRDQVLFRAGRYAAFRATRLWRAAAILFALLTGGVSVAWWYQPRPGPEVRIVEVPVKVIVPQAVPETKKAPEPVPAPKPPDTTPVSPKRAEPAPVLAHHRLQAESLRHGLESLPHLPPEKNPPHQLPDDMGLRDRYQGGVRFPFLFSGE